MDNPYQPPTEAGYKPVSRAFRPHHVALATFFGTGISGGVCLGVSEFRQGRMYAGVAMITVGCAVGIITLQLKNLPVAGFLVLLVHIALALVAYRVAVRRQPAEGAPAAILPLSGWWAALVVTVYWLALIGILTLTVRGLG